MAILKCKMCGGNLDLIDDSTVVECEYCGTKQTVPNADNDKKMMMFERANKLRYTSEFDKAASIYESIVADFPYEAEAYWGLVLCKYGIEYVDDPATGNKIPTCHRSSFDSVMDDSDFEQVMENADPIARRVYRDEAKAIEDIRKGILEVSSKEEPYDIFICYKETDENGERTIDSVIAQDIYDNLTEKGYRVFFARISLEDKLGQEYEPYIFAALNSAKIMLAIGTDYDYYNAVWVKNEWSRFLALISKGEKKTLIPCYKDIDAYDIPKEFKHLQAQDMGKVGAMQDLLRGIGKILGSKKKNVPSDRVVHSNESAMIQRGNIALEDRDFQNAVSFFERALDENPTAAHAYLGKFLAFHNYKNDDNVHIASVTKSIISLLIGIAIDKGLIESVNQKVLDFFPDYVIKRGEKTIGEVTLYNLLTMTAPYKYKSEPWTKVCTSEDWTKAVLDLLGGRNGITGEFKYSTLGIHILSSIITKVSNMTTLEFANKYLFKPLGIKERKNYVVKNSGNGYRIEEKL